MLWVRAWALPGTELASPRKIQSMNVQKQPPLSFLSLRSFLVVQRNSRSLSLDSSSRLLLQVLLHTWCVLVRRSRRIAFDALFQASAIPLPIILIVSLPVRACGASRSVAASLPVLAVAPFYHIFLHSICLSFGFSVFLVFLGLPFLSLSTHSVMPRRHTPSVSHFLDI